MSRSPMSFKSIIRFLLGLVAAQCFGLSAQLVEFDHRVAVWPDTDFDPAIPTLEQVLGYQLGERITRPEDALRYLQALAEAAPDRTLLVEYARSWEGRPLVYLLVGTEQQIAQLDDIKQGMQVLANPEAYSDDRVEQLVNELPAIVWLAHSVHGNEISGTDSAMHTAYHILAARGDYFDSLRASTLVAIDPLQNPDGRARFVHSYEQTYGIAPSYSAIAAERREPWPNGRTNHYLFDLNRDWLMLTQPEVRGRVATYQEYFPVVHVDLHEMGSNRSFYFPPPAKPFNPHITDVQKQMLDDYGRTNAKWFDAFGFEYFNREDYDALYPGYGDTWPAFHGGVGMTFEVGSARGMAAQRTNGDLFSFADTVERQFVGSIGTIETAANNRASFLQNFVDYRRSADRGDQGGPSEYLIPASGDIGAVNKLAGRLLEHGIEVRQTTESGQACDVEMPIGSFLVSSEQPAGRMVRTFLDRESPMNEDFLAEQDRRREAGLSPELYDVLGWSLPSLYNLEVVPCNRVGLDAELLSAAPLAGYPAPELSRLGYLAPWGSQASGVFLAAAMQVGVQLRGAGDSMTLAGREYGRGTLMIRVADNNHLSTEQLYEILVGLAQESGAELIAMQSSYSPEGVSFGSDATLRLPAPRVALAWDLPTNAQSAGNTRFVLERQFGYPVEVVRTRHLDEPELTRFDVLILPDGGDYAGTLGESGVDRLKSWVEQGGVLVTMSGGTRFAAHDEVDLLPTDLELLANAKEESDDESSTTEGTLIDSDTAYRNAIEPEAADPDDIPGVLMNTVNDPDHWLTAGVRDGVKFMVDGSDVYRPLTLDAGSNALRFADIDNLTAGGHLWRENRKQWAYKPAVMVSEYGDGLVIGFVSDPTFRAGLDGANTVFLNAVLRAPAHTAAPR